MNTKFAVKSLINQLKNQSVHEILNTPFVCDFCRWEDVGGNHIVKFPRVEAPNGLRIRVFDY